MGSLAQGAVGGSATARRAFLFAVPVVTAAVIAGHPTDPESVTDLGDDVDRYIAIHVGLLLMLPLLGIALWLLLEGVSGTAATVARVTLPIALVFYAAFDALIGIGSGVLSREALALPEAQRAGAAALAARWMEIPVPLSIVSGIAVISWTVTFLAAATAQYKSGASWVAVAGLALAGPLFGFGHPLPTGIVAMGCLLVAAVSIERRRTRSSAAP